MIDYDLIFRAMRCRYGGTKFQVRIVNPVEDTELYWFDPDKEDWILAEYEAKEMLWSLELLSKQYYEKYIGLPDKNLTRS